jgi:UDP-GlcNAc:undecaprenyl-phosphate GlcNAc-1-phosphate transferase
MDALSAGVAWIAAAILALAVVACVSLPSPPGKEVAELSGQRIMPLLLFMGALSGFLWFNRPPARIFMGDAGSTFLGFFLGFESLVIGSAKEERVCLWAMPVFVLAVAWYDLVFVVLLRLSQGRSPFHADKQHLSHRLVELGLRPPTAVRVIYLLALASGMGGVVLYQLNDTRIAVLIAVALACWWVAFAGLELGALAGRTKKKHEG